MSTNNESKYPEFIPASLRTKPLTYYTAEQAAASVNTYSEIPVTKVEFISNDVVRITFANDMIWSVEMLEGAIVNQNCIESSFFNHVISSSLEVDREDRSLSNLD